MERKYKVREVTPKENRCVAYTCPAIYEIEEVTPKANRCAVYSCPSIYDDKSNNYLIIGKKVNPSEFGLEGKVGKDEILIEIPKKIIDNKGK